jgi:hypothetical protein
MRRLAGKRSSAEGPVIAAAGQRQKIRSGQGAAVAHTEYLRLARDREFLLGRDSRRSTKKWAFGRPRTVTSCVSAGGTAERRSKMEQAESRKTATAATPIRNRLGGSQLALPNVAAGIFHSCAVFCFHAMN